ncbi:hypothetical protein [Amycolatopsis kentuckyensis]|uniref:hypothetical protein n=1 Tax=Amycolatopsis kentuckyensis TaxID=218823 RepID=UPI003567E744
MSEPELYFDPDGKPITAQQWANLRDELGKKMIVERHSLTDRSDPTWTIFVTTGWWGMAPVPGEVPPRIYRTDTNRVSHDAPTLADMAPVSYAWATSGEAKAGHSALMEQLKGQFSEPVATLWGPPGVYDGIACPGCGEEALRSIARPRKSLVAKNPAGAYLPVQRTEDGEDAVEAWMNWPYALCSACGREIEGKQRPVQ